MSDGTKIEWAANADGTPGATWNPIVGCSVVSPGCTNCYAMKAAARHEKQCAGVGRGNLSPYAGLTQVSKAGAVWNGQVRLWEPALTKPLAWRKPRTIFVNSMGDLFHEDVPNEWIDRVFGIMAACPQHTFIVLTKRAERMRAYTHGAVVERLRAELLGRWPLPNVWLGVSVEAKKHRHRLSDLLNAVAAVRVLSAEPLLEALDITPTLSAAPGLDWVIVGGESGAGARPMHPKWARDLRDQCAGANVPFFFKQWGEWLPAYEDDDGSRSFWDADDGGPQGRFERRRVQLDRTSFRDATFARVGKRAAGRLLDGRTHDARPPLACERSAP